MTSSQACGSIWSKFGLLLLIACVVSYQQTFVESRATVASNQKQNVANKVNLIRADESESAVIPSPVANENIDDEDAAQIEAASREIDAIKSELNEANSQIDDIIRKLDGSPPSDGHLSKGDAGASSKAVPVYVSPFIRPQQQQQHQIQVQQQFSPTRDSAPASTSISHQQESPTSESKITNYASSAGADLKTSASYGHHDSGYHGHGGYHEHKGWLDMGAWTGGKGSFGWYADYPVGSKKHHHYG